MSVVRCPARRYLAEMCLYVDHDVVRMLEFHTCMTDTRLDTIMYTFNLGRRCRGDRIGRRETDDLTLIQLAKGVACLIDSRFTPFGF